jgi:hypothetical protein
MGTADLSTPLRSPGFPATQYWTRPRVRLSLKERRMMFAKAEGVHFVPGVSVFVWVSVTKAMPFSLSFAWAEDHRLYFLRD